MDLYHLLLGDCTYDNSVYSSLVAKTNSNNTTFWVSGVLYILLLHSRRSPLCCTQGTLMGTVIGTLLPALGLALSPLDVRQR